MKKLQILLITFLAFFLVAGTGNALPLPDISFDASGTISRDLAGTGFTYDSTSYNTYAQGVDLQLLYNEDVPSIFDYLSGNGFTSTMEIYFNVNDSGFFSNGVMIEKVSLGTLNLYNVDSDPTTIDLTFGVGTVLLIGEVTSLTDYQNGNDYVLDFLVSDVSGALVTEGIWPSNMSTLVDSILESNSIDWAESFTGEIHWKGDKYPVPEPATMLLFGTGLLGLAVIGRKKFLKKS